MSQRSRRPRRTTAGKEAGFVTDPLHSSAGGARQAAAAGGRTRALLALEDVERPELAGRADRALRLVLRVAGLEVGAVDPGLEVLLGPPAGVDEADVPLVVGPQELERLEAVGVRDHAGAVREAFGELVETV